MKSDIQKSIASTRKMINDQISQIGIDLIYTNINEKCSFCTLDASGAIFQTVPYGQFKLGVAFSVCDNCGSKENSSVIFDDFIKRLFSDGKSLSIELLSINDLRQSSIEYFKTELSVDTIQDKDKDGGFEIIGTRKSGLIIIFRCKSLSDYAYIFILNESERFRIDTAAHHLDLISYGPDHLHDMHHKTIKESPTFGSPSFDSVFIKSIIATIEG